MKAGSLPASLEPGHENHRPCLAQQPFPADRLFTTTLAGGNHIAIERLNLQTRPWLRLSVQGRAGLQRVSPWAVSSPGAPVALGIGNDGSTRWLLLEGRSSSLQLPLADADEASCRQP